MRLNKHAIVLLGKNKSYTFNIPQNSSNEKCSLMYKMNYNKLYVLQWCTVSFAETL